MSLTTTQTSTVVFPGTRKRTSSFCCSLQLSSNPRPAKVPRLSKSMGATLRRTETYLCLSDAASTSLKSTSTPMTSVKSPSPKAQVSPISKKREQKDKPRRKASVADVADESVTHSIPLSTQTSPRQKSTAIRPFVPQLSKTVAPLTPEPLPIRRASQPSSSQRTATTSSTIKSPTPVTPPSLPTALRRSSPLSPTPEARPCRPQFPRSKPEPDLYKKALKTCMKSSPEGQKILRMGPRLAISIMTATRELERIVAAQEQRDKEMADDAMAVDSHPVLSKSWVVIPDQDWEMVDCSA